MQTLARKEQLLANDYVPHIIEVRVNAPRAGLAVLSDIHQGLNNRKLLKESVDFLLGLGPNVKVIVGGDCTNSNTRHSKGNPIEEWASGDKQITYLVEDIKPLFESGQLVGILGGNHPDRIFQETFINLEMMVACLLGDRELYKGSQGICYFNVNKILYTHYIMHKASRKEHGYDYFNADVTWTEHFHKPSCKPKVIVDHNKFAKKPVVKECWDIYNGSFQLNPNYAKQSGFRPYLPGFFVVEMGGESRSITPFIDHQLADLITRGYSIG